MRVVTISPVRPREMKKIGVRLRQGGISCCIIAVSPFTILASPIPVYWVGLVDLMVQ